MADQVTRVLAAVVRRNGEYLVCQRPPHKRHGGLWEFPGGKYEPQESPLGAARRELREELDVEALCVGQVLKAIRDPGSSFVIEFMIVAIEGNPVPLEHTKLAWFELDELGSLDLAPADAEFAAFLARSDSDQVRST